MQLVNFWSEISEKPHSFYNYLLKCLFSPLKCENKSLIWIKVNLDLDLSDLENNNRFLLNIFPFPFYACYATTTQRITYLTGKLKFSIFSTRM